MREMTFFSVLSSPIGDLLLTSNGDALTGLHMEPHPAVSGRRDHGALREARQQLARYFEGELFTFDLPLQLDGSPFIREVWAELQAIPYGTTLSYAELAWRVGRPGAARAVGTANAKNPIGIIVPCHRVIASGGGLGGYGGGLERKQWLLDHETACLKRARREPAMIRC